MSLRRRGDGFRVESLCRPSMHSVVLGCFCQLYGPSRVESCGVQIVFCINYRRCCKFKAGSWKSQIISICVCTLTVIRTDSENFHVQ